MPDTPRVERTCLVCDVTFEGTPKATRCKPCRDAGHRVPEAKNPKPRKPRRPGGLPHQRTCLECRDKFTPLSQGHQFCPECTSWLGLEPDSKRGNGNPVGYINEGGFIDDGLSNLQRELIKQEAYDPHSHLPNYGDLKAMTNMTQRVSNTPLGVLWLSLCAADGAAASVMFAATDSDLSEDDKLTLMATFYRLRSKGYHQSMIAKLCPKAILKDAPQAALKDLPKVDNPTPTDIHNWDQVARRATLGLL